MTRRGRPSLPAEIVSRIRELRQLDWSYGSIASELRISKSAAVKYSRAVDRLGNAGGMGVINSPEHEERGRRLA